MTTLRITELTSALGFSTRLLGPVQIITDMMLGMTKRVIVDRGSFFLPTPFPRRLADRATRGITVMAPLEEIPCSSLTSMLLLGWLLTLTLDISLPGLAW